MATGGRDTRGMGLRNTTVYNGSPLQYSCLENLRDGGAWWAAIYGVAQSWTQLKQLSSSSSSRIFIFKLKIANKCIKIHLEDRTIVMSPLGTKVTKPSINQTES